MMTTRILCSRCPASLLVEDETHDRQRYAHCPTCNVKYCPDQDFVHVRNVAGLKDDIKKAERTTRVLYWKGKKDVLRVEGLWKPLLVTLDVSNKIRIGREMLDIPDQKEWIKCEMMGDWEGEILALLRFSTAVCNEHDKTGDKLLAWSKSTAKKLVKTVPNGGNVFGLGLTVATTPDSCTFYLPNWSLVTILASLNLFHVSVSKNEGHRQSRKEPETISFDTTIRALAFVKKLWTESKKKGR